MFRPIKTYWLLATLVSCAMWSAIAQGQVVHYSFDDSSDFANDSTGNHNGAITGTLTATTGVFGGAADFGTASSTGSGRININSLNNTHFPTENATMAVWFRDHVSGSRDGFLSFGSGSNSHHTWDSGNDGYFNIFRTSRFNNVQYEPIVAPDLLPDVITDWHHLAIVNDRDNNDYIVYFDGEVAGQTTTTAFNIGARQIGLNQSGQWLDADLDEFYLFDEALSQEQIQNLIQFNNVDGAVIPEPSSIVAWIVMGAVGVGVCWWRRKRAMA